jgi:hypothetical protein
MLQVRIAVLMIDAVVEAASLDTVLVTSIVVLLSSPALVF